MYEHATALTDRDLESMRRLSDVAGEFFSVRLFCTEDHDMKRDVNVQHPDTSQHWKRVWLEHFRRKPRQGRAGDGQGFSASHWHMHVCGFFFSLGAGKNNVMAKWCLGPCVLQPPEPSPTQSTLADHLYGQDPELSTFDVSPS